MSLWRKAVEEGRRLVIAHRGARSVAPENTLEAAQKGFDLGADGWELDVRLSADGVSIIRILPLFRTATRSQSASISNM